MNYKGKEMTIFELSHSNKIIEKVMRVFGHFIGIYTADEYCDVGRAVAASHGFKKQLLQIKLRKIGNKRCCGIDNWNNIGKNVKFPHLLNIIINENAIVGDNVTIYQGVTIGIVESGKRKGVPTIKDDVVIGPGAVIVGGVTIGERTVIAGNSFVDFSVPSDCVVIGNPGTIHSKN